MDRVSQHIQMVNSNSKTIFAARLDFKKFVREKNYSFYSFVLRLKELDSYCKYDRYFDKGVRDRFDCGVNFLQFEVETRQRWREGVNKDCSFLTLNKLVNLAESMGRVQREMNGLGDPKHVIRYITCIRQLGPLHALGNQVRGSIQVPNVVKGVESYMMRNPVQLKI